MAMATGVCDTDGTVDTFGELLFGHTVTVDRTKLLDEDTTFDRADLGNVDPRFLGELIQAEIAVSHMQYVEAEKLICGGKAALQAGLESKRIKPQGIHMLPGDPAKPLIACAANVHNLEFACRVRHLGQKEKIHQSSVNLLEFVTDVYYEALLEDLGGVGAMKASSAQFLGALKAQQPKKWGEARTGRRYLEAVLFTSVEVVRKGAKCGMPRNFTVKTNEALTQVKPRGIINPGDTGCVIHSSNATLADFLELNVQHHLDRSVKHVSKAGLARRMGKLISQHISEEWYHSSDDFGSWDASCRAQVRDAVENRLLTKMHQDLGGIDGLLGAAAVADRTAREYKGKGYGAKIKTKNSCRQSGDKGTSALNRITSRILSGAVFVMLLLRKNGLHETTPLEDLNPDFVAEIKRELKLYFRGKSTYFDLTAEGDDGLRWYSRKLLGAEIDAPATLTKIVELYARFGFKLEPQTAAGRVENSCLEPVWGRYEFVSVVFKPYQVDGVLRVRCIPKPRRTLDSLSVSFSLPERDTITSTKCEEHAWGLLRDKSLALLSNAVDCPLLYQVIEAVHLKALAKAGASENRHFQDRIGYAGEVLRSTYGEDVATYLDQIRAVRQALSLDRIGDAAANKAFVQEMIGSTMKTGGLITRPVGLVRGTRLAEEAEAHARDMLGMFVESIQQCSPDTLVGVWGAWRKLL